MKTNSILGRADQILTKDGKTLDKVIGKGRGSDEPVEIIELNITKRSYLTEDGYATFDLSNWDDVKDKVVDYITNGKTDYIMAKIITDQAVYHIYGLQFTLVGMNGSYDNVEIRFLFNNPSSGPIEIIYQNMFIL